MDNADERHAAERKEKLIAELRDSMPTIWDHLIGVELPVSLKTGMLDRKATDMIGEFADRLLTLAKMAREGDTMAQLQLKAVEKILYPDTYHLPVKAIKSLVESHHTPAALARGWALRDIMRRIAAVLEPANPTAKNILDGAVVVSRNAGVEDDFVYPTVLKHWKSGVTLASLAIRIYLEQLNDEGIESIDEATLRTSLRAVADWDATHRRDWWAAVKEDEADPPLWRLVPSEDYSNEWKERLKKRNGGR
jgi:hypothetical protein